MRWWLLRCLLGLGAFVLLATGYLFASHRLPLSLWTVPLVLEALDRANDHAGVVEALGEPVRLRGLVTGQVRADETGWREFLISVPVGGPKAQAALRVRAGRGRHGRWFFTTLALEGSAGAAIDVMEPRRSRMPEPPGGRRLYLVALGDLERLSIDDLAHYYRNWLGLEIQVLPAVNVSASTFDPRRRQMIAEAAIETLRSRVGKVAADPSAIVIAITEHDMYIRQMSWGFAFSYRGDDRFAVVSAARMAPLLYEYRGKEYQFHSRIRKMVAKNIGLLVYRFPVSVDPTSLLRESILSVADLDTMRNDFHGLGPHAGTAEIPAARRQPPIEAEISPLPAPAKPNAGYPCFVVRPGILPPSGRTAVSAELTTCQVGMRTEREYNEFEVDLRSGLLVARKTDLWVPDGLPLALTRCFRLWDYRPRAFGLGTNHPYDSFPTGSRQPYTYVDLITADGFRIHYERISRGTGYRDAVYEHVETTTKFFRSRFQWNGNGWDLRLQDRSVFVFPESYAARRSNEGAIIEIRDAADRVIKFDRDRHRNLRKLTAPGGAFIDFEYDSGNRVVVAADDRARRVRYEYDVVGRLAAVTDPGGRITSYTYDGSNLVGVETSDTGTALRVRYAEGRVSELRLADGRVYRFRFQVNRPGDANAARAFLTFPDGKTVEFAR